MIKSPPARRFFVKSRYILSLITFSFIVLSGTKVKAQIFGGESDTKIGLGLVADYDMPTGNLKYTYKPAFAPGIGLYVFGEDITVSLTAGYRSYKPKQDTFYYLVSDIDYGTAKFSNFNTAMLYMGMAYNLKITEGVKLYGGINMGYYLVKFTASQSDVFILGTQDISEQEGLFAPKIGLNFELGDHLAFNVQGAYNIFATLGRKDFNSRVGTVYLSIASEAALIYKF